MPLLCEGGRKGFQDYGICKIGERGNLVGESDNNEQYKREGIYVKSPQDENK